MVIKIVSFSYIVVGRGKKNLLNISGAIGKWIFQYIKDLSALLSEVTVYREKKHTNSTWLVTTTVRIASSKLFMMYYHSSR